MGLNLKDVVVRERTSLEAFNGKVVAIDAYNSLYQFLSTIRGSDGQLFTDLRNNVTSHLSGLLHRNANFLSIGIKPVWIFDGKPPSLKAAEIERRRASKMTATIRYEQARQEGDMELARKYAQQTTSIQDSMIDDSKEFLNLFGIPTIQAPSEGEATAAHLTITGKAWASASQDYDSILFGAQRLVRNFTSGGRRKVPNQNYYINVEPEIIYLNSVLEMHGISREQLVDVGIMIGTDFNPSGIPRIGPKTAIKMIKKHSRLEDIPRAQEHLTDTPYEEVRRIFLEPDVADVQDITFGSIQYEDILRYLTERDFTETRILQTLNKMRKAISKKSETLDKWL
ncbi:MAG: flap endonuclease-1 [Cenarchaeum sp. SB0665_bin_23]|nr:flap endonuclease-1 [Cenarchaeum sp. SB0664_bin_35]MXY61648.1 flap endonuclease-1 [Cenarchaeum sp. SB0665_bin_23]MXZ93820.1 flap endonuclease-1 [Cenarchaeum sp. SB0666_bin_15]MYB46804.1 flap endonuclease-1 [Cenarchaeum sp. SB0662_bin_33]MYG33775.1 flap endonuclease-1 [Cenarchaeum sp. SB0677_bin_16]MYJ28097.1 flap endonuclease-1 [Cenarchaeum sp. SB0672_bin_9]